MSIVALAGTSLVGFQHANAATETWAPGGTLGGAGTWDTLTSNWLSGSQTTWTNGNDALFGTTAGTVGVDPNGISLETGSFTAAGYTVQGGTVTLVNTTPGFYAASVTGVGNTTTITSSLAGLVGAKFAGGGAANATLTIGSNSSYSGLTQIIATNLNFTTLAATGTNSSFGSAGTVDFGGAGSAVHVINTGAGGTTDRLWQNVGTSTSDEISNNSTVTGALSFTNTDPAVAGALGARTFKLDGTAGSSVVNTFAENVADLGTGTNLTGVNFAGGTWAFTNTSSSYSGGSTISSSTAIVNINNSASVGAGTVLFTANGSLSATAALALPNTINTGASTITAKLYNGTVGTSNTFEVDGLITGSGTLSVSTGSGLNDGPILLNNTANTFTGNFTTGFGIFQYNSVANAGAPSSLGEGALITIGNSSSTASYTYMGAGIDTTTRQLIWSATTGNLAFGSSGSGSVQYLATGNMRTGSGLDTLNLTGTSTGANALAETINDSGGVTSLTKTGAGQWVLTASNTYTGPTTVSGGTLTIDATSTSTGTANPLASIAGSGSITVTGANSTLHLLDTGAAAAVGMLSQTANVVIGTGAFAVLDLSDQTQTINTLTYNGLTLPPGTYGSSAYTGSETSSEPFLLGDGAFVVTSVPEPTAISAIALGAGGLLARRRRKIRVPA